MQHQSRDKAWGFALFCDDLRQEIGGKTSLMGLYQGDLIAQGKPPILLPKLCVVAMYYELKGAVNEDITFKLTFPGEKEEEPASAEILIPRHSMPPSAQKESRESETLVHARIPFFISPFVVFREGHLRLRAHYSDGRVLRLGSLRLVIKAPTQASTEGENKKADG